MPHRPIRAGVVGGRRGGGYGRGLSALADHIAVTAFCDLDPSVTDAWKAQDPSLRTFQMFDDLLASDACDAVILATPMELHAAQAVQALNAGKHVLSEVIAATTLDDCWALVEAVERSRCVYMLAENYCYMRPTMLVRNMVERGVFGTVTYAEGAYIHDCRPLMFDTAGRLTWRGELAWHEPGNSYPTHSLGPVAQWLGCSGPNATDRLTELVTLTTPNVARNQYVAERFGAEASGSSPGYFNKGDSASTLLRTARGAVIYLRVDSASPRPHNMTHYVLQGTEAAYLSARHQSEDPLVWIKGKSPGDAIGSEEWQSLWAYADDFEHARWRERGAIARQAGHGGGDYFIVEDFVAAIEGIQPPAIDVYDAVTWSSVYPLSVTSVASGGHPFAIPDFRRSKTSAALP